MKNKKNVLQNLDLINSISRSNMWGSWCDYLRLCFKDESEYIENLLDKLDFDNSNFCTEEIWWIIFTIKKQPTPSWPALNFSCSYNDISIPCCQFVKFTWSTKHNTNSYWKFDFYGSMFRLFEIWFLKKWILILFKVRVSDIEEPKVTRFDYRIDLFFKEKTLIPEIEDFCHYLHEQSRLEKHYSWYELTNWLVWSKTNWRYAIRYYNKLLDTDSKHKIFIYQDYFDWASVHRCEIEFQPNFLRGYTFYDFFNWNIEKHIESVLWLSRDQFIWTLFYKYEEDYIIKDKEKSKYLRKYSTSSVRLAKNNINPLIQCYRALFMELSEKNLKKNVNEFLDFVWQDKYKYNIRYDKLKKEFLDYYSID